MSQEGKKHGTGTENSRNVPAALSWALFYGGIVSAIYALIVLVPQLFPGSDQVFSLADFTAAFIHAVQAALVILAVCFLGRMISFSRPLMNKSFAVAGFLATFFGLAVLAILFLQLTYDAVAWFRVSPQLIRHQNEELRELAEKIENPDKYVESQLAEVRKAVKKLPPEKKANAQAIIQMKKKDLELTVEEMKQEIQVGIREETSGVSLLWHFITSGTSNVPQDSGIWPALMGSLWIAVITMVFAVPIGVGAALYLEEYRTSGWLGRLIQVNINNLAGVPSVVYGILGAFVFVEMIFRPLQNNVSSQIAARNLLGGGLTLGLLTLPVIIVAAQEAIRAVPGSIREGAYALGATQWQVIWHQVLPQARPGILTGTILAVSRAIGEAAPLVLFGALTFINENPSLLGRFSVLPLQIFEWTARPSVRVENEAVDIWRYNAAMASIVLLIVLLGLNSVAIYLRNRAQKHRY